MGGTKRATPRPKGNKSARRAKATAAGIADAEDRRLAAQSGVCVHWLKDGVCRYGATCKYEHPEPSYASSPRSRDGDLQGNEAGRSMQGNPDVKPDEKYPMVDGKVVMPSGMTIEPNRPITPSTSGGTSSAASNSGTPSTSGGTSVSGGDPDDDGDGSDDDDGGGPGDRKYPPIPERKFSRTPDKTPLNVPFHVTPETIVRNDILFPTVEICYHNNNIDPPHEHSALKIAALLQKRVLVHEVKAVCARRGVRFGAAGLPSVVDAGGSAMGADMKFHVCNPMIDANDPVRMLVREAGDNPDRCTCRAELCRCNDNGIALYVACHAYMKRDEVAACVDRSQLGLMYILAHKFEGDSGIIYGEMKWSRNPDGSVDSKIAGSETVYANDEVDHLRTGGFYAKNGRYYTVNALPNGCRPCSVIWVVKRGVKPIGTNITGNQPFASTLLDVNFTGRIDRGKTGDTKIDTTAVSFFTGLAKGEHAYLTAQSAQKGGDRSHAMLIMAAADFPRIAIPRGLINELMGMALFKSRLGVKGDQLRTAMTARARSLATSYGIGLDSAVVILHAVNIAMVMSVNEETESVKIATGGGACCTDRCISGCVRQWDQYEHDTWMNHRASGCWRLWSRDLWVWIIVALLGFSTIMMVISVACLYAGSSAWVSRSVIGAAAMRYTASAMTVAGMQPHTTFDDDSPVFGTYRPEFYAVSVEPKIPPCATAPDATLERSNFYVEKSAVSAFPVGLFYEGIVPTVVRATSNTEYDGLASRFVARQKIAHPLNPAMMAAASYELCSVLMPDQWNKLHEHVPTFEVWLSRTGHYSESQRAVFRVVRENLRSFGEELKQFMKTSCNIKTEKGTFASELMRCAVKAGRIVIASSELNNIIMGPIQMGVKQIMKSINSERLIYVPGKSPMKIGDLFEAAARESTVILESDLTRFDASVNEGMAEAEMAMLHYIGAANVKSGYLGVDALTLYRKMLTTFGRGLCGTKYSAKFRRASGRVNTTDGNTWILFVMKMLALSRANQVSITELLTGVAPALPSLILSVPCAGKTSGKLPPLLHQHEDLDALIGDTQHDPLSIDRGLGSRRSKAVQAVLMAGAKVIGATYGRAYAAVNTDGYVGAFYPDNDYSKLWGARMANYHNDEKKVSAALAAMLSDHLATLRGLVAKGVRVVNVPPQTKYWGTGVVMPLGCMCGDDSLIVAPMATDVKEFARVVAMTGATMKLKASVDSDTATLITSRPWKCIVDGAPHTVFGILPGRYFARVNWFTQLAIRKGEHPFEYLRGTMLGLWHGNSHVPFVRVDLEVTIRQTAAYKGRAHGKWQIHRFSHVLNANDSRPETSAETWAQFYKLYGLTQQDEDDYREWREAQPLMTRSYTNPVIGHLIETDVEFEGEQAHVFNAALYARNAERALTFVRFGANMTRHLNQTDGSERDEEIAKRRGVQIAKYEAWMVARRLLSSKVGVMVKYIPWLGVDGDSAARIAIRQRLLFHDTWTHMALDDAVKFHSEINRWIVAGSPQPYSLNTLFNLLCFSAQCEARWPSEDDVEHILRWAVQDSEAYQLHTQAADMVDRSGVLRGLDREFRAVDVSKTGKVMVERPPPVQPQRLTQLQIRTDQQTIKTTKMPNKKQQQHGRKAAKSAIVEAAKYKLRKAIAEKMRAHAVKPRPKPRGTKNAPRRKEARLASAPKGGAWATCKEVIGTVTSSGDGSLAVAYQKTLNPGLQPLTSPGTLPTVNDGLSVELSQIAQLYTKHSLAVPGAFLKLKLVPKVNKFAGGNMGLTFVDDAKRGLLPNVAAYMNHGATKWGPVTSPQSLMFSKNMGVDDKMKLVRKSTPTGVIIDSKTTDSVSFDLQLYDYGSVHVWSEGVTKSDATAAALVVATLEVEAKWWVTERDTSIALTAPVVQGGNNADHFQNANAVSRGAGATQVAFNPALAALGMTAKSGGSGISSITSSAINFLKTGFFAVANMARFAATTGGPVNLEAGSGSSNWQNPVVTGGATVLDDWNDSGAGFAKDADGFLIDSGTNPTAFVGMESVDVVQVTALPATYTPSWYTFFQNTGTYNTSAVDIMVDEVPNAFTNKYMAYAAQKKAEQVAVVYKNVQRLTTLLADNKDSKEEVTPVWKVVNQSDYLGSLGISASAAGIPVKSTIKSHGK